ncbi:M20/M25/M40 family metallo-hydrolase [Nostocoides australiense]
MTSIEGQPDPTVEALRAAVADGMPRARLDLARLVGLRSVFDPRIEDPPQCAAAASAVADLLTEVGLEVESIETPDGSTAVIGRSTARPAGTAPARPRVLLYTHHDVVPAGDVAAWSSDPWTLTERDGRWYGRGAADCKGNLVAILTALRALSATSAEWPVDLVVLVEGSEEQSAGGMEALARARPDLVAADVIVMADTGNIALGQPTLTTSLRGTGSVRITVRTMEHAAHSGMYGGAAPDALQALLTALASLRSPSGETTIDGLDATGVWEGAAYDPRRFGEDAALLDGVKPLGDGQIGDLLWARPAATVLAVDAPPTARVTAAVQGEASAIVNLRVPAVMDPAAAQRLLIAHLRAHTPYGRVEIEPLTLGRGFAARTDGPGYGAMRAAMREAFGVDPVTTGQGGSIPLTVALSELHPGAEIMLLGVEEPACRIHVTDESVEPRELKRTAHALALFLAAL